MKICFVSQNGHFGKLSRDFENCRTEFAWQLALDAEHFPIQYLLNKPAKEVSLYDVVIVILPKKLENFECGVEAKGNARLPFSVKYFLTAILFVLFDVEVIFFYPWATNFKEFGMDGLLSMALFVALFLLGFLYLRKKQAFKWE
jgi:NADH:ubiquinone oxidoreductase subunit 3 (subunit A)